MFIIDQIHVTRWHKLTIKISKKNVTNSKYVLLLLMWLTNSIFLASARPLLYKTLIYLFFCTSPYMTLYTTTYRQHNDDRYPSSSPLTCSSPLHNHYSGSPRCSLPNPFHEVYPYILICDWYLYFSIGVPAGKLC